MRRIQLLLIALMISTSPSAYAGVQEITVKVDGMACPFCAYNIEKRLKTLEGVSSDAKFDVSVERGEATLTWNEDVSFDPQKLQEQVKQAGFTPGSIELTASAHITLKKNQSLAISLPKTDQTVPVQRADRVDRQTSFDTLKQWVKKNPNSRIIVHGHALNGSPWQLVLHRWNPTDFQNQVIIDVLNLSCENCSLSVTKALRSLPEVIHAEADHQQNRIWIWLTAKEPEKSSYKDAIQQAGFQVQHIHVKPPSTKATKAN